MASPTQKVTALQLLVQMHIASRASLVAQVVRNLPAMQETWVQSLGWEDPGGGTGNPLQYSCLGNPLGRGAWRGGGGGSRHH